MFLGFLAHLDGRDGASRRLSLPTLPGSASPMPLPDTYAQALLLAELLGVHALSPALEFHPDAPLAVDATAWWRALQQRSIAATQRQRRQTGTPLPDALVELAGSDRAEESVQRLLDAHTDALVRVLQTLDRVNRRRPGREHRADEIETVLDAADTAVAFAAAQLLESWETTTAPSHNGGSVSVAVVNVLLQFCGVGALHAFHPHALVPSAARRVFGSESKWKCATCSRVSEVKGPAAVPLVYRCAACDFNLCRECFTRIPNHNATLESTGSGVLVSSAPKELQVARFFQLAFERLRETPERFNTVAWKLAFEVRRRVKELPLYRVVEAASCSALLVDMLAHPAFALQVVQHSECDWFPVYMNTGMMGVLSFLGPFLSGTTLSDELRGSTALDRGQALGTEWPTGFRALKRQFMAIVRALLAPTQHPYVVHATLCWLGCTVLSTTKRRRLNRETNDLLDGFLLNVSTALVVLSLPHLDTDAQSHGQLLDASYHVGRLSRRAFGDKNVREAPLGDLASIRGELYVRAKEQDEVERLRANDRACIQKYQSARATGVTETEPTTTAAFYPLRDAHYGVACNHCYQQNFRSVRYKCAFCDDIDMCASCFALFCRHSESARGRIDSVLTTGLSSPQVHMLDHVFIRVGTPVPLYETRHFEMIKFEKAAFRTTATADASERLSVLRACADCGAGLADAAVVFKCSNCFDPRFVCGACVAREEQSGDPHKMHVPGHLYFAITSAWQLTYSPLTPALHYLSLSHPSALLPRTAANLETELLFLAIKSLHYGPLLTLSKLIGTLKEMHDLQTFCVSEEQQLAYETQQRRTTTAYGGGIGVSHRPLKLSSHYSASKARLAELDEKKAATELHLLEISTVTQWLVFYAKACRWLLAAASPTQDASTQLLTDLSDELIQFPEHFFSDLCDMVYLLGLDRLEFHDVVAALATPECGGNGGADASVLVVEPILLMLTQLVASRELTRNPHLRVQALKALLALLGFFSKSKHNDVVKRVVERNTVLRDRLFLGVLTFHDEMDKYHERNNGLVFNSNASSGDQLLWGFLPTRVSVSLLLRYLWQVPSQRKVITTLLSLGPHSMSPSSSLSPASVASNQLSVLVSGLWSDVAKLVDEASNKIATLLQLRELQESALDGRLVSLPFRPAMMDGYLALHAKQLRLTFRMLVEALELLSWMADSAPFAKVLLKPELSEQSARIVSFLVSALEVAPDADTWQFSHQLVRDRKLVLAHVVVLVVRCAGRSDKCPSSAFWKLVHTSGQAMLQSVGDLDTRERWTLNAATTHLEAAQFLGATVDDESSATDGDDDEEEGSSQDETLLADDDDEMDEDDALALLEKQAADAVTAASSAVRRSQRRRRANQAHSLTRHLGRRFVSSLAKDGRFESTRFVNTLAMLQRPSASANDNGDDTGAFVDAAWVGAFLDAMASCREMIALHASMDAFMGDVPDEYLDPLLSTLMTDPVRLPSGQILDRSVIERHLLSAQHVDPFTREPLTVEMLVPCDALRREIRLYLHAKLRQFKSTKTEDVLATWGLAWDCLFDDSGAVDVTGASDES